MSVLAKSRLSTKAQTVIPRAVREKLGLRPGDVIAFEEQNGEVVVRAWREPVREDPFAVFHEWASPEDDEAYADL
ncbi:MAG TPA: AbrB/MazE/SpoVT family DNA-binding domain-containing protein [Geminicoccaceae bacterium]|nr:AbrB/MazE/SpoVT family DNA-binding domain-containing protein [Geminicoccus sp.]HMU49141.1 AbrB/MazE/SpoVT family DNA-binding domain-containing protein [Geminicoccaceae bacterium]